MRRTRQADDPIGRKQKNESSKRDGDRILSLVDRINLFCTETPAQRQEREAREEKERENKRIEMEAAANAKAEKNRTAMLSDAKNAVKFWRSLVPRKCQFRCGERIMDEDYQYHITQVCEYREVRCHLGCNLKLRWRDVKRHTSSECPERTVCCNREPCNGVFFKAKHQDAHDRQFHVAPAVQRARDPVAVARMWRTLMITYRFARLRARRFRNESVFKEFSPDFQQLWSRMVLRLMKTA